MIALRRGSGQFAMHSSTASVAFASLKSRMAVLPAPRQVGFRA
jgi:hypothetical protein